MPGCAENMRTSSSWGSSARRRTSQHGSGARSWEPTGCERNALLDGYRGCGALVNFPIACGLTIISCLPMRAGLFSSANGVNLSYAMTEEFMTISIRLTPDEENRLDALASRTGRSRSFYVRQALREHLDDLEDAYAADTAIDTLEASGSKSRPLSAVKAELGL